MSQLKKISTPEDLGIRIEGPFSEELNKVRDGEYKELSNVEFEKKYRHLVFTPASLTLKGQEHSIQLNYCANCFCKWYGQPQMKYETKGKPSRYKLAKQSDGGSRIDCNDITSDRTYGLVLSHSTDTLSNWSVAEEIKRLVTINSTSPITKEYTFHRAVCPMIAQTPFSSEKDFYTRGKSPAKSIRYQCKQCGKLTNVLPKQDENHGYNQKRNDVLIQLIKDLLGRKPVRKTCKSLGIGASTYYHKLEQIYTKCLQFLERRETLALKTMTFKELWLNTDEFIYYLNNVRQKGTKKQSGDDTLDKQFPTHMISSADLKTGYVFRSDVAYDFNVTLDNIEEDTLQHHSDHTYSFLRKNERLRYPYCPQPPTKLDTQTKLEFSSNLHDFEQRKNYVDGCHTKSYYTAIAHYWLLKEMLNVKEWFFVSDDSATLQSASFKVFFDVFLSGYGTYFVCQTGKFLSLEESGREFFKSRAALRQWGRLHGFNEDTFLKPLALAKLREEMKYHKFYNYKLDGLGDRYRVRGKNPIQHPLPSKDEGIRWVNLISDTTNLTSDELAKLILQVNSRAINNFFQEVRRSISTLERPLVTARPDGKSYIYANYNPKYAQYATTILRTFYNFCDETKVNGVSSTPAQRLGIADRTYNHRDIIYFR